MHLFSRTELFSVFCICWITRIKVAKKAATFHIYLKIKIVHSCYLRIIGSKKELSHVHMFFDIITGSVVMLNSLCLVEYSQKVIFFWQPHFWPLLVSQSPSPWKNTSLGMKVKDPGIEKTSGTLYLPWGKLSFPWSDCLASAYSFG